MTKKQLEKEIEELKKELLQQNQEMNNLKENLEKAIKTFSQITDDINTLMTPYIKQDEKKRVEEEETYKKQKEFYSYGNI